MSVFAPQHVKGSLGTVKSMSIISSSNTEIICPLHRNNHMHLSDKTTLHYPVMLCSHKTKVYILIINLKIHKTALKQPDSKETVFFPEQSK